MKKILKALNIDDCIAFFGNDEEIEKAENLESDRMSEIEKIIFDPTFKAMEYTNSWNQRRILHHSTRQGVLFQLSYIDADGVAAMHENYIQTSDRHIDECIHDKRELLRHFMLNSNHNDMTLTIL